MDFLWFMFIFLLIITIALMMGTNERFFEEDSITETEDEFENTKTEDIMMPKQDVDKNWRCTGCKAVNEVQNTHCEWCRMLKFIE